MIEAISLYVSRVFNAFSRLGNAVFLFGDPCESISARSYRLQWPVERVINTIFWWQNRHCRGAYNGERDAGAIAMSRPNRVPNEQPAKLWD